MDPVLIRSNHNFCWICLICLWYVWVVGEWFKIEVTQVLCDSRIWCFCLLSWVWVRVEHDIPAFCWDDLSLLMFNPDLGFAGTKKRTKLVNVYLRTGPMYKCWSTRRPGLQLPSKHRPNWWPQKCCLPYRCGARNVWWLQYRGFCHFCCSIFQSVVSIKSIGTIGVESKPLSPHSTVPKPCSPSDPRVNAPVFEPTPQPAMVPQACLQ